MPQVPVHPRRLVALRLIRRRRRLDPRARVFQPVHPVGRRGVQQRRLRAADSRSAAALITSTCTSDSDPARNAASIAGNTASRSAVSIVARARPTVVPATRPSTPPHPGTAHRSPTHRSAPPGPPPTSARTRQPLQLGELPRPAPSPASHRAPQDRASRRSLAATRSTPAAPRTRRAPNRRELETGEGRWRGSTGTLLERTFECQEEKRSREKMWRGQGSITRLEMRSPVNPNW